jgi:hypothetical protein
MSSKRPKTIRIFLIDGEPDGLRTVELSNWIGQALVIPRTKLKDIKNRAEAGKPGVYFLFGKDSEDALLPMVYIGEAEVLWSRLVAHDNKDFWQTAMAFISKDSNSTKAHVKYLESRCLVLARETKRSEVKNDSDSTLPSLPESDIADMEEFFDNLQILTTSLGYPIFQKVISKEKRDPSSPLFVCAGKGVGATGRLTNGGFVVYKGSTASLERSKAAIERDSHKNLIKKLADTGYMEQKKDSLLFIKDYIFNSPTAAAEVILGHPASGWERWKTENGQTLKEFYAPKGGHINT